MCSGIDEFYTRNSKSENRNSRSSGAAHPTPRSSPATRSLDLLRASRHAAWGSFCCGSGAKPRRTRNAVFVAINFCDVPCFKSLSTIFDFGVVAINLFFALSKACRSTTRTWDSTALVASIRYVSVPTVYELLWTLNVALKVSPLHCVTIHAAWEGHLREEKTIFGWFRRGRNSHSR